MAQRLRTRKNTRGQRRIHQVQCVAKFKTYRPAGNRRNDTDPSALNIGKFHPLIIGLP